MRCYIIICCLWLVQSVFLYNPRQPAWGSNAHCSLGSLILIIHQENEPQAYLQVSLMDIFATEVPNLSVVKWPYSVTTWWKSKQYTIIVELCMETDREKGRIFSWQVTTNPWNLLYLLLELAIPIIPLFPTNIHSLICPNSLPISTSWQPSSCWMSLLRHMFMPSKNIDCRENVK